MTSIIKTETRIFLYFHYIRITYSYSVCLFHRYTKRTKFLIVFLTYFFTLFKYTVYKYITDDIRYICKPPTRIFFWIRLGTEVPRKSIVRTSPRFNFYVPVPRQGSVVVTRVDRCSTAGVCRLPVNSGGVLGPHLPTPEGLLTDLKIL